MSGIKAAFPEKKLGVIWIDAHADIHSPYTSPSGNIHGMPLAAALSEDNLACQINQPEKNSTDCWKQMKNIGVPGAKLLPQHLVYFGLRDYETAEANWLEKNKVPVYTVDTVRNKRIDVCVSETQHFLQDCDMIYISFDVDSMDCEQVSRGTGTPVPHGFWPEEVNEVITKLITRLPVVALEVAEINPLLDNRCNRMAETAFAILSAVTTLLENKSIQQL
jgi:arginase